MQNSILINKSYHTGKLCSRYIDRDFKCKIIKKELTISFLFKLFRCDKSATKQEHLLHSRFDSKFIFKKEWGLVVVSNCPLDVSGNTRLVRACVQTDPSDTFQNLPVLTRKPISATRTISVQSVTGQKISLFGKLDSAVTTSTTSASIRSTGRRSCNATVTNKNIHGYFHHQITLYQNIVHFENIAVG